jgi:hypothetical protein
VLFAVKDVTENGFTISLKDTLSQDIMFNWTAIYVANVNTSTSDSITQQNNINTTQITPTAEPQIINVVTTATPTPTAVEQVLTVTPSPSFEAQQHIENTVTPTPTIAGEQQVNTNNNEATIDQILEITPTPMSSP